MVSEEEKEREIKKANKVGLNGQRKKDGMKKEKNLEAKKKNKRWKEKEKDWKTEKMMRKERKKEWATKEAEQVKIICRFESKQEK